MAAPVPDQATVRHNSLWDLGASVGAGLFTVFTLNFATVVARRGDAPAFLLSVMLAAPFAGSMLAILGNYVLPRHNRHAVAARFILAGRSLWLVAAITTTPLALTGLVFGHWILVALVTPVIFETIRDMYPPAERGRRLARTRLGLTASMTGGSLIAGYLLDWFGPQILLPIGSLFGLLGAAAWSRLRVTAGAVSAPLGLTSLLSIIRQDQRFRRYTVALVSWGFGFLLPGPLYPILLVDQFNASYTEVGLLGLVSSAAWLAGYLVLSRRIDRWSPRLLVGLSFALCLCQPLAYLVSPSVWLLLPGVAAVGLASAGIDLGGINLLMRLAPHARVPEYSSLLTSIAGLRGLVAPFVGSTLIGLPGAGPKGLLLVSLLLIIVGAASLARLQLPDPSLADESTQPATAR